MRCSGNAINHYQFMWKWDFIRDGPACKLQSSQGRIQLWRALTIRPYFFFSNHEAFSLGNHGKSSSVHSRRKETQGKFMCWDCWDVHFVLFHLLRVLINMHQIFGLDNCPVFVLRGKVASSRLHKARNVKKPRAFQRSLVSIPPKTEDSEVNLNEFCDSDKGKIARQRAAIVCHCFHLFAEHEDV